MLAMCWQCVYLSVFVGRAASSTASARSQPESILIIIPNFWVEPEVKSMVDKLKKKLG